MARAARPTRTTDLAHRQKGPIAPDGNMQTSEISCGRWGQQLRNFPAAAKAESTPCPQNVAFWDLLATRPALAGDTGRAKQIIAEATILNQSETIHQLASNRTCGIRNAHLGISCTITVDQAENTG